MKHTLIAVIATALVASIPTAFAHGGGGKKSGPGAMHGKSKAEGPVKGKGEGKGGPGRGGKGTKGGK